VSDAGHPQKATVTVGDRTAELPILSGTEGTQRRLLDLHEADRHTSSTTAS
jgi:hypothetical protein